MFDGDDQRKRTKKLRYKDESPEQMIADYQTEIGELEILRMEAEECSFIIQNCNRVLRYTRLPLVKAEMENARNRAELRREDIRLRIIEIRDLQDRRW